VSSTGRTIASVAVWPVDVPLSDPFVISRGAVTQASVAFVRVRLDDGSAGYGEIAPFTALTGETRDGAMESARRLAGALVGRPAEDWIAHAASMSAAEPGEPAARSGLECALVDALARSRGLPLHRFWHDLGGTPDLRERETDMTLPLLEEGRLDQLAAQWHDRGFRTFKLKVGGDLDADIRRVERIARRYSDVSFILDANQGFDLAQARAFVDALAAHHLRVRLIEQPLAREDVEGMAALRQRSPVAIAADEAVFTLADARRVIAARAADCINLKITKSGLAETIAIAREARGAGLALMIGGMMETRLAMSFSYALVLALGWIEHLDLDTPLLMATDPLSGGYTYRGPALTIWNEAGAGATPRWQPDGP